MILTIVWLFSISYYTQWSTEPRGADPSRDNYGGPRDQDCQVRSPDLFFDATREEKNGDFSSRNGALASNNGDFNQQKCWFQPTKMLISTNKNADFSSKHDKHGGLLWLIMKNYEQMDIVRASDKTEIFPGQKSPNGISSAWITTPLPTSLELGFGYFRSVKSFFFIHNG